MTYSTDKKWEFKLPIKSQGTHVLSADLYIQDARAAASIRAALAEYAAERSSINLRLGDTIDESEREALQKRLEEISSLESELRENLSKIRRKIGSAEGMEIYAQ